MKKLLFLILVLLVLTVLLSSVYQIPEANAQVMTKINKFKPYIIFEGDINQQYPPRIMPLEFNSLKPWGDKVFVKIQITNYIRSGSILIFGKDVYGNNYKSPEVVYLMANSTYTTTRLYSNLNSFDFLGVYHVLIYQLRQDIGLRASSVN